MTGWLIRCGGEENPVTGWLIRCGGQGKSGDDRVSDHAVRRGIR